MHLVNKLKLRDESGFAFIAALLAMLIMVSLGVLIFTLTTRDVRVTIKLMGEKKAFSAAEHGIHWLMQQYVPGAALVNPATACGGKAGFFHGFASGCTRRASASPTAWTGWCWAGR